MSTLNVGTIKSISSAAPVFQNTSRTEMGQLAKAWVNFSGTGTVAINDSFNVSSITDSGSGRYIVNLSITMSNTNFVALVGGIYNTGDSGGSTGVSNRRTNFTTTSFGIRSGDTSTGSFDDSQLAWGAVFGD